MENKIRKQGEVCCDYCGTIFKKPISEIKRNLELGRLNYCTRICLGKANIKYLPEDRSLNYDISQHCANQRDDFTPFRYYLRKAVYRKKGEVDLTLGYLKELWDKQQGKCAYSGLDMILYQEKYQDPRITASLDRIDSSKGYVQSNVQFILVCLHYCKGTMTDSQMREFLTNLKQL